MNVNIALEASLLWNSLPESLKSILRLDSRWIARKNYVWDTEDLYLIRRFLIELTDFEKVIYNINEEDIK